MFIENTSPKELVELVFNSQYYGIPAKFDYIESGEIVRLISSFDDDIPLRKLFIENVLKDLPIIAKKNDKDIIDEKYQDLVDFINTSKILPLCIPSKPSENIYKFFTRLTTTANELFQKKIERDFEDICIKAENIGIIKPELHIDSVKHNGNNFQIITTPDTKKIFEYDTPSLFTFYKISESLYVLWVKPDDVGMFLEAWIYHILKSHFSDKEDIDIYFRTKIYKKTTEELKSVHELIKAKPKQPFLITDIDISIFKKNIPICGIECKTEGKISDVIKFYGILKLLDIPDGIFLSINHSTDNKKKYRKFENIHIFEGVTENKNLPSELIKTVTQIIESHSEISSKK